MTKPNETVWTDLTGATEEDRRTLLGDEFASVLVRRIGFSPNGLMYVECFLDGDLRMLVGDPQKALATYLGGRSHGETMQ